MRFYNILAVLSATAASAFASTKEEDAALDFLLAHAQQPEVIAAEAMHAKFNAYMAALTDEDCTDSPEIWQDAMDNDCSWYGDYAEERCLLADEFKSEAGSADDVCCVCGGGAEGEGEGAVDAVDITQELQDLGVDLEELMVDEDEDEEPVSAPDSDSDLVPFRPMLGCASCEDDKGFEDLLKNDCDYYAEHDQIRCPFAEIGAIDGYDAKQACCACGGGESQSCEGEYYIQNVQADAYIAVLYGRIRAPYVISFPERAMWTKLKIKDLGDDKYAIASTYYDDRWLCVGGDGRGLTSCQTISKASKFTIESHPNGREYFIQSVSNKRYWNYNGNNINNGQYTVTLVSDSRGSSSRWKLVEPASLAEEMKKEEVKKNLRSATA